MALIVCLGNLSLIIRSFFLEKNMLSYFLHIMRQKSGGSSFVCVQLLQTLNILFENIRNETSLCKFEVLRALPDKRIPI